MTSNPGVLWRHWIPKSLMQNSPFPITHFPSDWKQTLLKPLLKKARIDALFDQLRPISSLQFASKLAERAVCNQTYENLMLKNLLPELQSAYRKRYSTECKTTYSWIWTVRWAGYSFCPVGPKLCFWYDGSRHSTSLPGDIFWDHGNSAEVVQVVLAGSISACVIQE